ncbi:MAG: phosphoribosylformylglycinamidine synthase subunit PurS [Acidimicrobiia bacterium]|jgi:phosphoribosylformylglycinamidine synthase|nr:phosphoribosylformylglycinamidine synthase subunit PurS [Acidimicrobiia bacterium]
MATMLFSVQVEVSLREGVADPQGATVERSLPHLGFDGVRGVRVGKSIRFEVEAADEGSARREVDDLCRRFLTNPVIEDSSITITTAEAIDAAAAAAAAGG